MPAFRLQPEPFPARPQVRQARVFQPQQEEPVPEVVAVVELVVAVVELVELVVEAAELAV